MTRFDRIGRSALGAGGALLLGMSGADAAKVAPETPATAVTVTNPATTAAMTVIRRVGCQFYLYDGDVVYYAFLNSEISAGTTSEPLPVFTFNSSADNDTYYGINADAYMPVAAGFEPQVVIEITNPSVAAHPPQGLYCTLTGNTIN
ncbi:MAG TPA: hypothetical protein VKS60_19670 [Stellaceae bacterium]|nr:hypothetical protein [Stellaceae bacterium]